MNLLVAILVLLGSFVMLLAAIGLVRFPDFYTRIHAAGKAASFGLMLLLLAFAIHFNTWLKPLLVIVFIFLTTPIAMYLISRVASRLKIPYWQRQK
ncbi:Na+/H+ antiporter subunit G [candidate division KSB1 bacterium]|jgi:multicomponent Na+:H+ antiporter subunit G|nr:Na+/H+ antiporter subunit G [candidate division KSB1 bacterium]